MEEKWKHIDFATNYEVSNLGNIRNTKSGVILNPGVSGNGYKQVSLKMIETNQFKKQYVHRLVAQFWVKNDDIEHKKEVNHKNLDRTDNRAENLEWLTSSDNQKHKYETNPNYKTSNRAVAQLDLNGNIIATYPSVAAAARALKVSRQGIDKIVHGNPMRKTAHGFLWKFLN